MSIFSHTTSGLTTRSVYQLLAHRHCARIKLCLPNQYADCLSGRLPIDLQNYSSIYPSVCLPQRIYLKTVIPIDPKYFATINPYPCIEWYHSMLSLQEGT